MHKPHLISLVGGMLDLHQHQSSTVFRQMYTVCISSKHRMPMANNWNENAMSRMNQAAGHFSQSLQNNFTHAAKTYKLSILWGCAVVGVCFSQHVFEEQQSLRLGVLLCWISGSCV